MNLDDSSINDRLNEVESDGFSGIHPIVESNAFTMRTITIHTEMLINYPMRVGNITSISTLRLMDMDNRTMNYL